MADPLSILGGVAASIQLVEVAMGALVGTVKFAREFGEIPHKIAVQLDDVNRSSQRVHFICQHIIRHDSNVAIQLNPIQVDRLASAAENVRLAAKDAESLLLPLLEGVDPARGKAIRRLWRTVVSMTQESAVLEKLRRVDKLNLDLIEELQTASITMQAEVQSMISKASVSTTSHQIESLKRLDSLLRLILQAQSTITTGFDGVAAGVRSLETSNTTLIQHASKIENKMDEVRMSVGRTTEAIQQQTSHINDEIQKQARMGYDDMQRMIHRQELRMTEEIRSMRDQLIMSLTGLETPSTQTCASVFANSKLTDEEQNLLRNNTITTLMRYPTAIRDAWGQSIRFTKRLPPCDCRVRTKTHTKSMWYFRLEAARKSEHRDGCAYKQNGHELRTYSFFANCYPFLESTVEIVLGATTGPGIWSVTNPLRIQRIVKHAESPVFRAFSSLPRRFMTKKYSSNQRLSIVPDSWVDTDDPRGRFQMVWASSLAQALEDLVDQLKEEVSKGIFAGSDIDEQGNTILFSFSHLILMLGHQWKQFEQHLSKLFIAIIQCGVDVGARAKTESNIRVSADDFDPSKWSGKYYTAFESLFQRGFTLTDTFDATFPLYSKWIELDAVDDFEDVEFIGLYGHSGLRAPSQLKTLWKHVEVAEACGYDDLALAVIRRSLNDVVRLTKMDGFSSEPKLDRARYFTHLELAVGWVEGIESLMQMNFDPIPAITQACRLADAKSLRSLLQPSQPLFTTDWRPCRSYPYALWLFNEAIYSRSTEVQDLIIMELKKRRERLYQIALMEFSQDEATRMGLDKTSFLLGKAASLFSRLQKEVAVPVALDCCSMASPFHLDGLLYTYNSNSSGLRTFFDRVYEAGFTDVDEEDEFGQTPLFQRLRAFVNVGVNYPDVLDLIDWFMKKGARAFTGREDNWPNVMFYVASSWMRASDTERHGNAKADDTETTDAVDANSTISVMRNLQKEEDNCVCYCSSSGCTPAHLLMRCHLKERDGRTGLCVRGQRPHVRSSPLQAWMKRWGNGYLNLADLSRELCQMQIFERLGMAHTCCKGSPVGPVSEPYAGYFWQVIRPPSSDIELMQSEDAILKAQLDEFLKYYDLWYQHLGYDTETFEETWWRAVDEILPLFPMIPARDCQCCSYEYFCVFSTDSVVADQKRAEEHKEILRELGYDDFEDFRDVIIDHFENRLAGILEDDTSSVKEDDEGDYSEESSDSTT